MGVQVMGVAGREMPGLKKAQLEFTKNNRETGDALLNVTDGARGVKGPDGVTPLTENDPRPAYVHASFPKMLYHAKLGERVVDDTEEMDAAIAEGFQAKPFVVVKVAAADPGVEKANLQRELLEKQGQITTLATEMAEMRAQMAELIAANKKPGKKGE